jgi:outer membrane protein assembly factor BamB
MKIRGLTMAFLVLSVMTCPNLAFPDTTEMWVDQHDGGGNFIDSGTLLSTAPDGNLIVGGKSTEVSGGADLFVRKLNKTDGEQLWEFRFDGVDDKDVTITEITWDSVGQVLVSGYIEACTG